MKKIQGILSIQISMLCLFGVWEIYQMEETRFVKIFMAGGNKPLHVYGYRRVLHLQKIGFK